jgi:hypothetical protein
MPAPIGRAFEYAVILAREAGIRFHPGEVQVRAFCGAPDEPGAVTLFRERPVYVFVNAAREGDASGWCETILHEFAHARYDAADDPGVGAREARARAFAVRAMERWRW